VNAIVDWVRLELRSGSSSGTVVAARQALLQRDGDIVDTDGVSPVVLAAVPGSYFVAVAHRNHLSCMTQQAIGLGGTAISVNLSNSSLATFGTDARRVSGATAWLWSGNVLLDDKLAYTGEGNDRDPILSAIGGVIPTATVTGYLQADVNLDGIVRYTGADNDRDPILSNIGGTVPTNVRIQQLP
jgi:hypothetical protein